MKDQILQQDDHLLLTMCLVMSLYMQLAGSEIYTKGVKIVKVDKKKFHLYY